jgi:KDO2-lipid IV(A) lauroyltransferase
MKVLSRLSSEFQYWGTRAMIRLIRTMPYHPAIAMGRSVMLLIWAFMPLRRRIVRIQMGSALGQRNPWRLVLKVFMNQGDILIDTIKYAYMSTEEIRKRIQVEGKEHLDEALASNRGLLMFTGHIGNWEILSHFSRLLNVEFCIMADVRKDARLESIIDEIRSRSGATILPPKGKALMLIKELRKGRTIGMVVDQRGKRKDGLFCTIFGLPAITNPAPAFIAIKGGALVLPVYIVKEHGRYRICIMKAVDAAEFGEGPDAIKALSDFMQSTLASVVEQYPDQWFWLHSRWVKRANFRKTIRTIEGFREFVLSNAGKKAQ